MRHLPRAIASSALAFVHSIALVATLHAQQGTPPSRPAGARPPAALPTGTAEVRGRVLAEGGQALPDAAVSLRSGTTVVAGALAGSDGRFRVRGLVPGSYTLRVTRIGYAPRTRPVQIGTPGARVELDTIVLAPVAVTLGQVAVSGEADAVSMQPDRNAYRAKDLAPAAANASEVLEVIPAVNVDADGKVSLRGNENVVVQINGRPTPLRGQQLAAFLRQLPGPIVERVEVVPNPSAKYDPEGMAGIINIVLKQEADLGASAGMNAQYMNAERWNGSGNAGWQAGRLSLFGSIGASNDARGFSGINDRERFDAVQQLTGIVEQDLAGTSMNRGQNLTGNLDFRITPRDVLSQALVVNRRESREDGRNAFLEFDGDRTETDRYLRPRDARARGWMADWTSAWKRTVVPRRHEIAAEFRVNRTVDDESILLTRRTADGLVLQEGETNGTDARATQLTAQLDWTRAIGQAWKLETGLRSNSRWLDRSFIVTRDPDGSGTYFPSPLSNTFDFDEHVQAGYGVLTRTLGRFELQGGLRGEYTSRLFALTDERYPYDYFSLFPSAAASWQVSPATTARASYSRRIRRPGTQELNPFPQFMDAQNAFVGNPSLRPEFTDAVEFSLARTGRLGSLQVAPFYRRTSDIIRIVVDPDGVVDGRPATTVSFVNLATSDSYGADLNATWKPSQRFNLVTNGNVFRMVTDGGSASSLASDAIAFMGRLNATAQVTKAFALQATYFYRAPMNIERGRFEAVQMLTLVARHKVQRDRGTITLRIVDPFNTNRFAIRTGTDALMQVTTRQPGVRGVFLGYQFATGQAPRLRQPRPDAQPQGGGSPGFGGP